ncbi:MULTISPECIES: hypothetical protein [unclassified Pseudomonas]|uniref:hypothetical protein n=1 Tax=unclassified Pseudomonas TaxID=196821 RepID=UPI000C8763AD|nr:MULTISPECIES: hypothetical protein [unclassified Pseudomonas]PMU10193.1 hypothetical protein C1Y11_12635 [Pseudomonas sp. FW305-20]PMU19066.1 hypothetical protein C1Y10_11110 [Pseudomonas sp. FW305-122]PMU42373.1 hypothetical protein C1Y12_05210 [Pseudomonas sp. FW305-47B]PMX62770.1 hypothetical protein C1Y13_08490 [Pseudomonas sp. FW305-33]PMX68033.1 hypothetical protein C1X12_12310 [Pseudomonas sp. FW305-60]
MILVRRNSALIPEKILKVAERAQIVLEALPEDQRKDYIEKKGYVWRSFGRHLAKMSYGKCWYSESKDAHSFQDVDHFRPKKNAKRADGDDDDGYPWLAFSWDNFRFSSQRANRLSTNEDSEETVGKGSWFPLLPIGKKATWEDRCISDERPVLLDPTVHSDVRLIEVKASGQLGPSRFCLGKQHRERVTESIKLLGLDLPGLVEARQVVMRAVQGMVEDLERVAAAADSLGDLSHLIAETLPIDEKANQIQQLTRPMQPFASAVRAQLREMGYGEFCLRDEEIGLNT